jgi:hypothetical protein
MLEQCGIRVWDNAEYHIPHGRSQDGLQPCDMATTMTMIMREIVDYRDTIPLTPSRSSDLTADRLEADVISIFVQQHSTK